MAGIEVTGSRQKPFAWFPKQQANLLIFAVEMDLRPLPVGQSGTLLLAQ